MKKLLFILPIFAVCAMISCGNRTAESVSNVDTTIVQDTITDSVAEKVVKVDTIALIDARVKKLSKDNLVLRNDAKGIIVYSEEDDLDDCDGTLYVENVITGKKKSLKIDFNEYLAYLEWGRNKNEVYYFDQGGSGAFGGMTAVDINAMKIIKYYEVPNVHFKLSKRTSRGFRGTTWYESDSDEAGNRCWVSYDVEIDFYGNVIWQGRKKTECQ